MPCADGFRRRQITWSMNRSHGQSTLEYAIFVGVVTAALITMSTYVRRAIQANLKTVEGQVNAEAVNP